jgi:hypothetical protein
VFENGAAFFYRAQHCFSFLSQMFSERAQMLKMAEIVTETIYNDDLSNVPTIWRRMRCEDSSWRIVKDGDYSIRLRNGEKWRKKKR